MHWQHLLWLTAGITASTSIQKHKFDRDIQQPQTDDTTTTSYVSSIKRCGTDWLEANENCHFICQTDQDCLEDYSKCWRDLSNDACTATAARIAPSIANPATAIVPFASSLDLGASIEGISVTCDGNFAAVGASKVLRLDTGQILLAGSSASSQGQFASSYFLGRNLMLVGDALAHLIYIVEIPATTSTAQTTPADVSTVQTLFPLDPRMLQPNDFTVDKTMTRVYMTGQNYTATTTAGIHGDLWYYNMVTANLIQISPMILGQAGIHRTNGIDLSPDGKSLYVTSAQNLDYNIASAKIFRFDLDARTKSTIGKPVVVVDLGKELWGLGVDPTGMDPDGLKCDVKGNLYVAMNGGGIVFRWDPVALVGSVIRLSTVMNPSNLQFGGVDGKRLVVVGRGCRGDFTASCADFVDLEAPGRGYSDLKKSGRC
ncbi:hypothetical protein BDR26DRAFT_928913 [Obelidium mucronatum]|nr:hypothetical protein BDR26DRAFT_928913 [Obelidium mucronatum]